MPHLDCIDIKLRPRGAATAWLLACIVTALLAAFGAIPWIVCIVLFFIGISIMAALTVYGWMEAIQKEIMWVLDSVANWFREY